MSEGRAALFGQAKREIRKHPDWTDEQVAAKCGIHMLDLGVVATARRDVEADGGPRPAPQSATSAARPDAVHQAAGDGQGEGYGCEVTGQTAVLTAPGGRRFTLRLHSGGEAGSGRQSMGRVGAGQRCTSCGREMREGEPARYTSPSWPPGGQDNALVCVPCLMPPSSQPPAVQDGDKVLAARLAAVEARLAALEARFQP